MTLDVVLVKDKRLSTHMLYIKTRNARRVVGKDPLQSLVSFHTPLSTRLAVCYRVAELDFPPTWPSSYAPVLRHTPLEKLIPLYGNTHTNAHTFLHVHIKSNIALISNGINGSFVLYIPSQHKARL